ncbi:MAG: DUF58 domain-containing protein [Phycisphaeraceae bacterium]|nr:DUF58 domain-containing protein [Phycisphaeraceae bacterium]MCW5753081.1 DUF58 domain-containing protein [Phycisphaeraceae bacterium]
MTILTEEMMREVRRLQFRTRRRVTDLFAGNYHSAFKGSGIEFAEVREYEPGDDVRSIDWNVTARAGRTFVKRFVEERQLTVMLALDVSGSGMFASVGREKAFVAAELAAVLAYVAGRHRDRVGLLTFAGSTREFIPPATGRTHLLRIMRELVLAREPAGTTDIPSALAFLGNVLRRKAVIFVLSDFLAPQEGIEGWEPAMRLLNRRHEVIAVRLSDRREGDLPAAGLVRFRDAETGATRVVDLNKRTRKRTLELAERTRREAERAMARCGVDRIDVSTDRPFVHELYRAFRRRGLRR